MLWENFVEPRLKLLARTMYNTSYQSIIGDPSNLVMAFGAWMLIDVERWRVHRKWPRVSPWGGVMDAA